MRRNGKKRILSALLAAVMMCSLYIPTPAVAAQSGLTGSLTAAVRIDYAQRLSELASRNVQVELQRGGVALGSVSLTQEGVFDVGGYQAAVTPMGVDGGELGGGQWPGFLEVTFEDLPQGDYSLAFAGRGYKS